MPGSPRRIHAFHFAGEAVRGLLEREFPDREYVVWSDPEEFTAGIAEVELLLALRPPRGHWGRARRLRLIQMSGAGIDSLLPAPDLPPTVGIANARGVHDPEMPEFILASIFALAKRQPRAFVQQSRREWKMYAGMRLEGATLGVLGLGEIGRSLAKRACALGMRVIGTRRGGEPVPGVDRVHPPHETARVLAESDVVVVLLPLTPETRGLIDAAALAALPRHALLVNVARGGIVDEIALAAALREGRLAGAAVDVFDPEPPSPDHPLWDAPGCLVTPHVAGVTRDYMDRVGALFVENVRNNEAGRALRNQIDRDRGY